MSERAIWGRTAAPIAAYTAPYDPPFLMDIRPTVDLPAGFPIGELRDSEIWDGREWTAPEVMMARTYKVQ